MSKIKTDKWGAKTYETGVVVCNKTGNSKENEEGSKVYL